MASTEHISVHPAMLNMTAQLLRVSLLLMERGKVGEGKQGVRDAIASLEEMLNLETTEADDA